MCMVDFNIGHTFETCGISYLYTLDLNFRKQIKITIIFGYTVKYTQRQWKVTSKSHTLNIGQYLVHPVRRTADTSTLNFMA